MDVARLEEKLGVYFRDRSLLKQALTHRSYLNDNRSWPLGHNERLEFLGDAVLELVVTEHLFRKSPQATEGQMTQHRASLVRTEVLGGIAESVGLGAHVLLSRGEEKNVGRARVYILGRVYEALIGAVYLDQGYEVAKRLITNHILKSDTCFLEDKAAGNYKGRLQEYTQGKMKVTPQYRVLSETGLAHEKEFLVGVYFGSRLIAQGKASSKKRAEECAARTALALQVEEV